MENPECFGVEYYSPDNTVCPYVECILRKECRDVHNAARGIVKQRRKRSRIVERKQVKREIQEKNKRHENLKVLVSDKKKARKVGYKKPGRLLYKDEGTLRDKYLGIIRAALTSNGYRVRATKCLHSFDRDGKYLLKVETKRKNSIVVFMRDELSEDLVLSGIQCRALFDSERANYPIYLKWVSQISNETDMNSFMDSVKRCYKLN